VFASTNHSSHICINLFKNTNLNITFRQPIQYIIYSEPPPPKKRKYFQSGIYSIKCLTCSKTYVGQTGRYLKLRYHELMIHKNKNPQSAYAMHILNTNLEIFKYYGPNKDHTKKNTHEVPGNILYTKLWKAKFIFQGTETRWLNSAVQYLIRHFNSAHACKPCMEHFYSFIAYTLNAKHVVSVMIFTEWSLSSSLSLST